MKKYRIKIEDQTYEVEVEEIGRASSPVFRASGPALAAPARTAAPVEAAPAPAAAPAPKPAAAPAPKPAAAPAPSAPAASGGAANIDAGVAGKVFKIAAAVGQQVKRGDAVIILEAMKMEIPVVAPQDGTVDAILVSEGDAVEAGQTLATLK